MSRKDRNGTRKRRSVRRLSPKMGYYIVVTDTEETEKCFFNGLRDSLSDNIRKNLVIKVFNGIGTRDMIAKCIEEV